MERLEDILLPRLQARRDEPAFWFAGHWITGGTVWEWYEENVRVLQSVGFSEGQRLVTLLPNTPALFALALAVWKLKGTLVPLNQRSGSSILAPTVQFIDPFAVVIASGDEKAALGVEGRPIVALDLQGSLSPFTGRAGEPGKSSWAVFFTTSGTTGMPKSVPLTHENLISNVRSCTQQVPFYQKDTYLWALPNFHSFGMTLSMLLPNFMGAKTAVVQNFMPPLETLRAIEAARCSVLFLVPAMMEFFKRSAAHNDVKPKDVRLVITGGDRLNLMLDQASQSVFGVPVLEGYGTTECSPVVAVNPSYDRRKLGTIGPILPGFDWEVRDEERKPQPAGVPGRLWVRGPSVFEGYYKSPEITAERLLPDGWYDTGDVVKYDEDGFITVLDRALDIIIVGGYNVYPQEVERVLAEHPAVASCAVVSMKHLVNGEIPRAFVVLKEGTSLTERELISFCKGRLANYKIPRKVDFVESLPLSPAGKVLRRKLREME